jgi:prepilin-type N-terminal cleavage/methylation domain-containing protein
MISLKRKQSGFTIVELLIVIVVIGILAALVVTTFAGIQRKARNTERETDIKAVHGQLEAYFAQNNSYPTLAQLNDATFRSDNLKGLDAEALQDPKGADPTMGTASSATQYGYNVTCDTATPPSCPSYILTANVEGTTDTYEKRSLN